MYLLSSAAPEFDNFIPPKLLAKVPFLNALHGHFFVILGDDKILWLFWECTKEEGRKVNCSLRLVCIVHLISVLRRRLKSAALGKR